MKLEDNKGITLLEILIVVALIAVVIPVLNMVFIRGLTNYATGSRYMTAQSNVSTAYLEFRRQFEMCSDIEIEKLSAVTNILSYVLLTYDPSSSSIKIVPTPNPSNVLKDEKFTRRWEFDYNNDTITETGKTYGKLKVEGSTFLDWVNITTSGSNDYESGFYYSTSLNKIWMKILPKEFNEDFGKDQNISTPIYYYFDCSGKNLTTKP